VVGKGELLVFMDLPVQEGHHNRKCDNRKSGGNLGTCHDICNIDAIHCLRVALRHTQRIRPIYRIPGYLSMIADLETEAAQKNTRLRRLRKTLIQAA
jgi:hypothetical protein